MRRMKVVVGKKQSRTAPSPLLPFEQAVLPDCTLIPEQFFTPAHHSIAHRSGVKRLLFAVLQDAVACWFRYRHAQNARGRRLFQETQKWFWATDKNWLFAFEHICEHLKLDPEYIRRGLTRWHPHQPDQQRPLIRAEPVSSERHLSLVHP